MKKAILGIMLMLICGVILYSEPSGQTSLVTYRDVVELGRNEAVISEVVLSTTTDLAVLASSRDTRADLDIINDSGYTVRVGVVNSTITTNLIDLDNGKKLSDEIPALRNYTGIVYGHSDSTQAVTVIEIY